MRYFCFGDTSDRIDYLNAVSGFKMTFNRIYAFKCAIQFFLIGFFATFGDRGSDIDFHWMFD